jgi:hypothetical protein
MSESIQKSKIIFKNDSLETNYKKIALVSLIKKDIACYVFHAYDPKNSRFLIVKVYKKVSHHNLSGGLLAGTLQMILILPCSPIL